MFSQKEGIWFFCKTYSIAFIPLLISAHLSKTFDKWNSWMSGIILPFKDPFGTETFQAIFVENVLIEPGKILAMSTLIWFPLILLSIGGVVSLLKIIETNKYIESTSPDISPLSRAIPLIMLFLISSLFFVNVLLW